MTALHKSQGSPCTGIGPPLRIAHEDTEPISLDGLEGMPQPWEPLRQAELLPAMPFPVDVFPECLASFCQAAANSLLCPTDFVGMAMLATSAAAIGQSVNLEVKRGWNEAPLLYAITVASPGRIKTPAIRIVTKPLNQFDQRLREEAKKALKLWEEMREKHAKDDNEPPPGRKPRRLRAIVKDITRESLILVLSENPRGVLCSPDEAAAWTGSFNQYKSKGNDRQFWLSTYSGDSISVDRKGGDESIHVPYPFCGVLAGIQPDILATLKDERGHNDGFLDRIVFSYPDTFPKHAWTDEEMSKDVEEEWFEAITQLYEIGMREDGEILAPWVATFTTEAKAHFTYWFDQHSARMYAPGSRSGAMSKAIGRCARFALILSRLRLACDSKYSLRTAEGVPPVEPGDVNGAIRLTDYFANHLERVINQMSGGFGSEETEAIIGWIKRNRRNAFRESEIRKDLDQFRCNSDVLTLAIKPLLETGAIRRKDQPVVPGKAGRKASHTYEVHPEFVKGTGSLRKMDP